MSKIELPNATLFCGDALSVIRSLDHSCISAVVTDPPFGMDWCADGTRFSGGQGHHHKVSPKIHGDDQPFDPSPWLDFPEVILWGSNHYANRLPTGTTLVWAKKSEGKFGKFLSDAEIGWQKGGHGVYLFSHVWDGCARESEHGQHFHPTQKPIQLCLWWLKRLNLPPGSTVLDPYMGSGPIGLACQRLGLQYIGIDIDPHNFATAERRLRDAAAQGAMNL